MLDDLLKGLFYISFGILVFTAFVMGIGMFGYVWFKIILGCIELLQGVL